MFRIHILTALLLVALIGSVIAQEPVAPAGEHPAPNVTDVSQIQWETNDTDPPIGDPKALKGGTYYTYIYDYPLTFRLMGPNSNDAFASWNRAFTMDLPLIARHPNTDNYIPWLATHWSIQPDHRTVYYKLDPDARWSDGEKVTADDYVFTWEMMLSEFCVDPFYVAYANDHYESVQAIDDYTLKVVGKHESWRPLSDFALWATPRHAVGLGPDWVTKENTKWQTTIGPYKITEAEAGKRVVFTRVKDWWGENKRYMNGLWNPDEIVVKVIPEERELDYFQKGELSHITVRTARIWAEEMNFDAYKKGWTHQKREFVEIPSGVYGLAMNLEKPFLQNKDFRKALQYLFDFDEINSKIMYNAYYRQVSAFEGTEYENKDLKPYGFDPKKAREHLTKAGFTKRGPDGIFVNDKGERAAFELTYGSKGLEPHLTIMKEKYKKFGIEVNLKSLEGATAFERGLQREFEVLLNSRTAGFYPDPHQYFGSEFLKSKDNNNVWAFGTPETDELINIFRFNMDKQARLDAMHKLDAMIQDEAFYLPFWDAPYMRFVYWDNVCFPESFFPRRTEQYTDWFVFWIDPEKTKRLEEAKKNGTALPVDTVIDVDPWGVKAKIEAAAAVSAAPKSAE
ncbi:ABC transporter substrate-binding protein [Candidatus Poribacteria bacterium]|nr:ABC transporter substrate-binding protein [Candidatus Poribacteria bacterium]